MEETGPKASEPATKFETVWEWFRFAAAVVVAMIVTWTAFIAPLIMMVAPNPWPTFVLIIGVALGISMITSALAIADRIRRR